MVKEAIHIIAKAEDFSKTILPQFDKTEMQTHLYKIYEIFRYKIADCDFSTRTFNCLTTAGNETLHDVLLNTLQYIDRPDPLVCYLQQIRNMGERSITEVKQRFEDLDIRSVYMLYPLIQRAETEDYNQ